MNYFIMYKSCYWYFFFPSQPVSKIVNKLHRILWLILVKCVLKTKNVKCTCKMGCKFICCCCLVTKLYPCLSNSMDCSPPASFVHGISLARTLEWVAICQRLQSSWPGTAKSRGGGREGGSEAPPPSLSVPSSSQCNYRGGGGRKTRNVATV